jgi:hypothetical protein
MLGEFVPGKGKMAARDLLIGEIAPLVEPNSSFIEIG